MFNTLNGTNHTRLERKLEATQRFQREQIRVVEHERARELVAPHDITRRDAWGRLTIVVPAGQPPASWVELTAAEKAALVHPDDAPKPKVHTGAFGFNPEDAKAGRIKVTVIGNPGPRW